jgi:rSAM/selenodomain-associated transferase 1
MASNARRPDRVRVAVFAKAPVPGTVKTRLAARLGDAGAASLHARLVQRALATAKDSASGPVELWCAPDASHAFFLACAREHGVTLHVQAQGDLGARMANAFAASHAEAAALVVIGCDCPALRPADIARAAAAMGEATAALAPAEDGGYGLIALASPCDFLFDRMPWGTDRVMAETRARLDAHRVRWMELPTTWDVDRPEDYDRLLASGLLAEAAA